LLLGGGLRLTPWWAATPAWASRASARCPAARSRSCMQST